MKLASPLPLSLSPLLLPLPCPPRMGFALAIGELPKPMLQGRLSQVSILPSTPLLSIHLSSPSTLLLNLSPPPYLRY